MQCKYADGVTIVDPTWLRIITCHLQDFLRWKNIFFLFYKIVIPQYNMQRFNDLNLQAHLHWKILDVGIFLLVVTVLKIKYTNPAYRHSYFCKQKLTALPDVPVYLAYNMQGQLDLWVMGIYGDLIG